MMLGTRSTHSERGHSETLAATVNCYPKTGSRKCVEEFSLRLSRLRTRQSVREDVALFPGLVQSVKDPALPASWGVGRRSGVAVAVVRL